MRLTPRGERLVLAVSVLTLSLGGIVLLVLWTS